MTTKSPVYSHRSLRMGVALFGVSIALGACTLTNDGTVGYHFTVLPNVQLPFTGTPFTVYPPTGASSPSQRSSPPSSLSSPVRLGSSPLCCAAPGTAATSAKKGAESGEENGCNDSCKAFCFQFFNGAWSAAFAFNRNATTAVSR